MSADMVLRVVQQALMLTLILSAPAVLVALVVGTVISVLQAATQINESSLSSVPKTIVVFGAIALTGLWLLQQLVLFAQTLMSYLPAIGRG